MLQETSVDTAQASVIPARFRFEPAGPPPVPVAKITLRPPDGMPVRRRRAHGSRQ
jgi:hypothetical protein